MSTEASDPRDVPGPAATADSLEAAYGRADRRQFLRSVSALAALFGALVLLELIIGLALTSY